MSLSSKAETDIFLSNTILLIRKLDNHVQWLKVSNRGLDSLIWQTEWKTAPLAKIPKCRSKKLKPNFGSSCYNQLFVCQLCVQRLARVFYFWFIPCMIVKLFIRVPFRSSMENLPGFPGADTSLL